MFEKLKQPQVNMASVVLRFMLAAIVMLHGYLNLTEAGKYGEWAAKLTPMTMQLVAWCEIVGGIALVLGLLSRLASLGLAIIQTGAVITETGGAFIRLYFRPDTGPTMEAGSEYNFALIAMCLAVMLLGSGVYSVDHLIWGRKAAPQGTAAPATS